MEPTSSAMDNALASHYPDPSLIPVIASGFILKGMEIANIKKKITKKIG